MKLQNIKMRTLNNKSNFNHFKYYKSKIKSAFSLIELSIVLIIIGLLVAGVTGGASLITSARNRSFINEVNGQKQALLAFKAARGRYPGDIRNLGKFGYQSGYTYSKTDFAPPFDTGSFTPATISAPYVELYTEGISDFKPTTVSTSCTAFPCSKAYPKIAMLHFYDTDLLVEDPERYIYNFRTNMVVLKIERFNINYRINTKIMKVLDEKIDDGLYNSGNLRSYCFESLDVNGGATSYNDSINTKGACDYGYYDLRLE